MRVLHLVKTSDGATWAAEQAAELVARGVDVHVVIPSLEGRATGLWRASGAVVHQFGSDLPIREPWRFPSVIAGFRRLFDRLHPDLVHSHFFGTTVVMRLALGRSHLVPRVYQVAGPLHLEHAPYRRAEIGLAGPSDFWIGSSRYITDIYQRAGVSSERLFLSYYGIRVDRFGPGRTGEFRAKLGIPAEGIVVGNISYFYAPKRYLGQTVGVKRPEMLIEALGLLVSSESRLWGVLAGAPWGRSQGYLDRLRRRAARVGDGRILLPGLVPSGEVTKSWTGFDLAVHVPMSENCGGVVEPLLCGVPVLASRTGGLPEVIVDGRTGTLVDDVKPARLASAIRRAINEIDQGKAMAARGQRMVRVMFDVARTAGEVHDVYRHLLEGAPPPVWFDPRPWCGSPDG